MHRLRQSLGIYVATFIVLLVTANAKGQGACGVTTYTPNPPATTHQALYITDPAGQQTAVFDLSWGGALASLKYNGVETIWGYATGAMAQVAWFGTYNPSTGLYYNPTQAGDLHDNGTPVLEAACNNSPLALIISGTTDYSRGQGGTATGNTVWGGQFNFDSFATPYTVTITATFVPNPGGTPSYYLKMDTTIANVHQSENQYFSFGIAAYSLYSNNNYIGYPSNCTFKSSNCPAANTPTLVAGMYPNTSYTGGLAVSTSPSTYFNLNGALSFFNLGPADDINQNQSVGLWATPWLIPPGTSRHMIWYVMVGDWSNAVAFAQTHS